MATTTSSSMAAPAAVFSPRPAAAPISRCAFPCLRPPPISFPSFHTSFKLAEHRRSSCLQVKVSSSPKDTSVVIDTEESFADLKEKWDAIENKSIVLTYGGGAIFIVWLSSTILGAINSVPLLPKVMELVGLGYSGWFVYRYLLFQSSRKELAEDIEQLKKKILGTEYIIMHKLNPQPTSY